MRCLAVDAIIRVSFGYPFNSTSKFQVWGLLLQLAKYYITSFPVDARIGVLGGVVRFLARPSRSSSPMSSLSRIGSQQPFRFSPELS